MSDLQSGSGSIFSLSTWRGDWRMILLGGAGTVAVAGIIFYSYRAYTSDTRRRRRNQYLRGYTSEDLLQAAWQGDKTRVIEILETTNISVDCQNVYGFTPLFLASEREHLTIVRLLVARGADVDRVSSEGYTALIYAVRAGLLDTVKTLLDIGADVNTRCRKDDSTPIIHAVLRNDVRVLTELLAHNASVSSSLRDGSTPLVIAVKKDLLEASQLLLECCRACDVNARIYDGSTPLMIASRNDNVHMARMLVRYGANVNARNQSGNSSLMYACYSNSVAVAHLLVNFGAEVNIQNDDNVTCLQMAAARTNDDTLQVFLLEHGAVEELSTPSAIYDYFACKYHQWA